MTDQYDKGYVAEQRKRTLTGRWGDGAELAAVLIFLVSEASSYVIGQVLVVDGGVTIS